MYLDPSLGADAPPTATFDDGDQQWVRLIPPGVSDSSVRLSGPAANLLEPIVRDLLAHTAINGLVDILTYPGVVHQEYLLRIRPEPDQSSRAIARSVMRDNDRGLISDDDVDPLPSALGPYIAARLMGRMGVEIVQCDLSPLGVTPAPTTRLLSTTDGAVSLSIEPEQVPFAQYLQLLRRKGIPHVGRITIGANGADSYHVEQQLALLADWSRSLDLTDLAQLLTSEAGIDIADHYETPNLSSLIQLLEESDWELPATHQRLDGVEQALRVPDSIERPAADAIKRLVTTELEYDWLRGELANSIPLRALYENLSVQPTLTIPAAQLPGLLGYAPNYTSRDERWTDNRRGIPLLEQITVVRSATETDHTHPARQSVQETADGPNDATRHVPDHLNDLAKLGWARLREHGDTLTPLEAPTAAGIAYHRRPPDGAKHPVMVGTKSSLRPGDLVAVASAKRTSHLTVVTDTKADARWVADTLREPFIQTEDDWTHLYPLVRHYWTRTGSLALIPHPDSAGGWWYSATGEVELRAGDEVVVSHQMDEPIGADKAAVHWGHIDTNMQPSYLVECPDGDFESFENPAAVAKQYQPVCLYATPAACSYLHTTTIFYREDKRLRPYSPQLPTGELDVLDIASPLQSFVETYTCVQPDESLSWGAFSRAFQRYLYPQTSQRVPNKSTIKSAIEQNRAAVNPNYLPTFSVDGQSAALPGRDWQYSLPTEDPQTLTVATNAKERPVEFGDALMNYLQS